MFDGFEGKSVILYSTGCPKCKVLKKKLEAKNVKFTENTSVEDMQLLGIQTVPVLRIESTLYGFVEANNIINNYKPEVKE